MDTHRLSHPGSSTRSSTRRSRRAQQRPRDTSPRRTDHTVDDFVRRTTAHSHVPIFVEDAAVLDQIARLLT
jgi:hypothetical protein